MSMYVCGSSDQSFARVRQARALPAVQLSGMVSTEGGGRHSAFIEAGRVIYESHQQSIQGLGFTFIFS